MSALNQLWEYQKVDLQISAVENKLKASPTRQKLLVARNYLRDAQQNIKNMEAESSQLRVAYDTAAQKMEDYLERIDYVDSEIKDRDVQEISLQEVDRLKKEATDLREQLNRQEREIQNIFKGIERIEGTMKKLIANVPKAKSDFDILKKLYDGEAGEATVEAEPLKATLESMEPALDPALLKRYKAIKRRSANPMAPVVGGQCTGCNMELPSAAIKKLATAPDAIIDCDNCGRMLFIKD